ncbi:ABC transporter permease [Frankia sp. CcI49]|nr:ABC transporter permease [Frankia sp. CcI49]
MTGTGTQIRLILRRDRVLLPCWVFVLGILPAALAASFAGLYPTAAERQQFAATSARNGALIALYGPLRGSSLGELVCWRAGFLPVVIGLISALVVIRHTRAEEEAGRRELVGATAVGRHSGLAAALAVLLAANLVLAVIVTASLSGRGLPTGGSLAFGLTLALGGWVFAAVGAVAAQVTTGAGSARGIACAVVAAAYAMRVVGDGGGVGGGGGGVGGGPGGDGAGSAGWAWLSWLSPIGLLQRSYPFGARHWWVCVPAVGMVVVLVGAAVALSARRDLGAGVFPDRPGPAQASPSLRSPLALAWRLHRGLLVCWVAGSALLGLVFGGVAGSVGDLVGDNPGLRDVFTRLGGRSGIIDAYFASVMSITAMLVAGYAIQAVLRLRAEEIAGRAEPVLATAAGRLRWAASHLVFAALGPTAALLTAGIVTGLVHGLSGGGVGAGGGEVGDGDAGVGVGGSLSHLVRLAAPQLPAVAVLAAIAVMLFGVFPRLWAVSWVAWAGSLLIGLFGTAAGASHWLLDVSPFTHTSRSVGGSVPVLPLSLLTVLAALLVVAGLAGLRRRDLPAG